MCGRGKHVWPRQIFIVVAPFSKASTSTAVESVREGCDADEERLAVVQLPHSAVMVREAADLMCGVCSLQRHGHCICLEQGSRCCCHDSVVGPPHDEHAMQVVMKHCCYSQDIQV